MNSIHSGLWDVVAACVTVSHASLGWGDQSGSSTCEEGASIGTVSNGSGCVCGYTAGARAGHTNSGSRDVFLARIDSQGSSWSYAHFGTRSREFGVGIVVSGASAHVCGQWYSSSNTLAATFTRACHQVEVEIHSLQCTKCECILLTVGCSAVTEHANSGGSCVMCWFHYTRTETCVV